MDKLALTAMALISTGVVWAAGMERWGESGDWTILIDPEKGNG